jgi:hypothetical protein
MKISLNYNEKLSFATFGAGLSTLGGLVAADMPLAGMVSMTILCTYATITFIGEQIKRSKQRTPLKHA